MKRYLIDNLKNIWGWKTDRKIVVFAVDDYGNVRLASKKARQNMINAGLKLNSRFDYYDSIENKEDLEMLFEVLSSYKDKNGHSAIFTALSVPCNINFEKMENSGYQKYQYELLPETFDKLTEFDPKAYSGTWEIWKEGLMNGLFKPQFHGREHFNLKIFMEKLNNKDKEVIECFKNRSFSSISSVPYKSINWTSAFAFDKFEENFEHEKTIIDGIKCFHKVFGYKPIVFNSPGEPAHNYLNKILFNEGIKYIESPFFKNEHHGNGKFRKTINFSGKKDSSGSTILVRNCVFEPGENNSMDWVNFTFKQIETAFKWKRPAIISSHRVNFCGHIDNENRKTGLSDLKKLLDRIVKTWPDVEFFSLDEVEANLN